MNARLWPGAAGAPKGQGSAAAHQTTWLWNLHADAHAFEIELCAAAVSARKVFSSSAAHGSAVAFWLAGMHFHGAYFSSYLSWCKDPVSAAPLCSLAWPAVGQDILNADSGSSCQGLEIAAGLMPLWRSLGAAALGHLKIVATTALLASLLAVAGSYFHMHCSYFWLSRKSRSAATWCLLLGLSSCTWSAHLGAVSLPAASFADSGLRYGEVGAGLGLLPNLALIWPKANHDHGLLPAYGPTAAMISSGFALGKGAQLSACMSISGMSIPGMTIDGCAQSPSASGHQAGFQAGFQHLHGPAFFSLAMRVFNSATGAFFAGQISAHHFSLGFCAMASAVGIGSPSRAGLVSAKPMRTDRGILHHSQTFAARGTSKLALISPKANLTRSTKPSRFAQSNLRPWHAMLAAALGWLALASAGYAWLSRIALAYAMLAARYASMLSVFCHHLGVAGFLLAGAGAHASIHCILEERSRCSCDHGCLCNKTAGWSSALSSQERAARPKAPALGSCEKTAGLAHSCVARPFTSKALTSEPAACGNSSEAPRNPLPLSARSPYGRPQAALPRQGSRLGGSLRPGSSLLARIGQHRDLLLGHLAWVSISLGFHSFGLYLHNDIFQALGLPQDLFHDLGCQLKPVAAAGMQTPMLSFHVKVLERKLLCASPDFGTADLMVHHVHAFGLHVTTLILAKAILYAGTSRLVSSKARLGFRSPCDGPGRGGTCQISAWDHVYLAVFWLYNALSVVWFHYFWKMQSEVWGRIALPVAKTSASGLQLGLRHISGDFSLNPHINAWLGGFLWAQAAQVIQSYASSLSGYGFLFISAHFLWAFSLMFLFSGRGYWQEFIESLLWAHVKLKLAPAIQARALSISQGRAAGLSHSALGGIGCSWAFFLSRMLALV